jgi:RHS repeat-associated protein
MFYEPDSGLYLTQFRAYDPVAGRWLSRDPAGEVGDPSNNLYAYVGGNPLGIIDPLGLCGGPFDDLLNALASSPLLLPMIIGTEIVGGGPENPIADAAVVAEIEAAEAAAAAEEATGGTATINVFGSAHMSVTVEAGGESLTTGVGNYGGQAIVELDESAGPTKTLTYSLPNGQRHSISRNPRWGISVHTTLSRTVA